jgi:hypothetical protein
MVRSTAVTQEEVCELAKNLIGQGEKPTIGRIRELLGNRGSPNTISRFLKNWREGEIDQIRQESETIHPQSAVSVPEPEPEPVKAAPVEVKIEKPLVISVSEPEARPKLETPTVEPIKKMPEEIAKPTLASHKPMPESQMEANLSKQGERVPSDRSQANPPPYRKDKPFRENRPQQQAQGHHGNPGQNGHHQKPPHAGPRPQQALHSHSHGNPGNAHPGQGQHQHQNNQAPKRDRQPMPRPVLNFEDTVPDVYVSENLDTLNTTQLVAKVRRLESILNKEVSRRERADLMARDAKEYAEAVKAQIGSRINDIRQSMEITIDSLQAQLKALRENAEKDLRFYREALQKAHSKLTEKF